MLKEYFEIQNQIQKLEKEKNELRLKLIEKGTHSSREFICEVSSQTRRSISLTEIEKADPEIAKSLEAKKLIKVTTVEIVKVTQKKAA